MPFDTIGAFSVIFLYSILPSDKSGMHHNFALVMEEGFRHASTPRLIKTKYSRAKTQKGRSYKRGMLVWFLLEFRIILQNFMTRHFIKLL